MQDDLCHPYILSTTILSDNQQDLALKWNNRLKFIASPAYKVLGLIRHSFSSGLDTKAKKNLEFS